MVEKENTGITLRKETIDEIDDRRHSNCKRSWWINDAADVRLALEDEGLWEEFAEKAELPDRPGKDVAEA